MDLALLEHTLTDAGEPPVRARQVWAWAARGASGYEAMTDVPAALRARLADEVPFSTLAVVEEAHARDGTVKTLFHTADGRAVEAVLMRYRDGRRGVRPASVSSALSASARRPVRASCFQLRSAPPRSTDNQMAQSTDISWPAH